MGPKPSLGQVKKSQDLLSGVESQVTRKGLREVSHNTLMRTQTHHMGWIWPRWRKVIPGLNFTPKPPTPPHRSLSTSGRSAKLLHCSQKAAQRGPSLPGPKVREETVEGVRPHTLRSRLAWWRVGPLSWTDHHSQLADPEPQGAMKINDVSKVLHLEVGTEQVLSNRNYHHFSPSGQKSPSFLSGKKDNVLPHSNTEGIKHDESQGLPHSRYSVNSY